VAADVPPLGYRAFVPVTAEAESSAAVRHEAASATLENDYLKATFDADRGVIRSLVDKRTGRELVEGDQGHGLGQYLYERFDDGQVQAFVQAYVKISAAWASNELGKPNLPPPGKVPYRAESPKGGRLSFEMSPAAGTAVCRLPAGDALPHAVTTRFTVPANEPWLEIEMTLHDKPADPWPEAGWICLPFKVESPQFRLGRLGSIIDPVRDIVPGANRHLLGLNTGLAVFDETGQGAGVCALDHPLVSLGEPGCWKFSKDYVPRRGRVFVNLFNNQWTTNFRLWNEGTWTSRVRVWPIGKYAAAESLAVPSLEARYPFVAAWAEGAAGRLPATHTGIEVSRRGVLVSALRAQNGGIMLRLWEHGGARGPCDVRLPDGLSAARARAVDLRNRAQGQPIPISEGKFSFGLTGFEPRSFFLSKE
jgi:hypothetical protein